MENGIIGHEKILDFFAQVVKNGKLSHAYCFVGPDEVGKRAVAEKLAADLLGVERAKLVTHPDFVLVEQEFSEKKERTNKDISVEQIRSLRQVLGRCAYLGGWKAAIIDEAEKMNSEAANALLKTLEEPAGQTVLFLITKDENLLPGTIVSRCQTIYFHPVAKEEIRAGLPGASEEICELAWGKPGRVKIWQENSEEFQKHKSEIERFNNLLGKNFFEKSKAIEPLFQDTSDSIANREKLQSVLALWRLLIRNRSLQSSSAEWVEGAEKKIVEAGTLLAQNVNPRLIFENILLTLPPHQK